MEERPIMFKLLKDKGWCWVCPWCHRKLRLVMAVCPDCRHKISAIGAEEYKGKLNHERKTKTVQK